MVAFKARLDHVQNTINEVNLLYSTAMQSVSGVPYEYTNRFHFLTDPRQGEFNIPQLERVTNPEEFEVLFSAAEQNYNTEALGAILDYIHNAYNPISIDDLPDHLKGYYNLYDDARTEIYEVGGDFRGYAQSLTPDLYPNEDFASLLAYISTTEILEGQSPYELSDEDAANIPQYELTVLGLGQYAYASDVDAQTQAVFEAFSASLADFNPLETLRQLDDLKAIIDAVPDIIWLFNLSFFKNMFIAFEQTARQEVTRLQEIKSLIDSININTIPTRIREGERLQNEILGLYVNYDQYGEITPEIRQFLRQKPTRENLLAFLKYVHDHVFSNSRVGEEQYSVPGFINQSSMVEREIEDIFNDDEPISWAYIIASFLPGIGEIIDLVELIRSFQNGTPDRWLLLALILPEWLEPLAHGARAMSNNMAHLIELGGSAATQYLPEAHRLKELTAVIVGMAAHRRSRRLRLGPRHFSKQEIAALRVTYSMPEKRIDHAFDRHIREWLGVDEDAIVTKHIYPNLYNEWIDMINYTTRSNVAIPWSTG